MKHLPIFIDITRRPVLIVGGGTVAARKTETILRAGGHPIVVSPAICPALAKRACEGRVRHMARGFQDADMDGCVLVVSATEDVQLNRRVYTAADTARIPVNVVDRPALCTFIMPAIVDRSPLVIAISSGGAAPVLARHLKARLEALVPASYGRLARLAGSFRAQVRRRLGNEVARRRFWETVFQSPAAECLFTGQVDRAYAVVQRMLDKAAEADEVRPSGEVYVVGTASGDPDLLTLRALRLMQQADVVLYDRLVAGEILDLVRRDAEHIEVGDRAGSHIGASAEINKLMVDLARAGHRVLRLEIGDPLFFGRGDEAVAALAAQDIPIHIVPCIAAAARCVEPVAVTA